jgi:N-dimethylarginine dimethylaminohydrolase
VKARVQLSGFNEFGCLQRLVLRSVEEAFVDQEHVEAQWQALGYTGRPDFARAADEYARFVEIIRGCGCQVDYLPGDERLSLDALYVRDAVSVAPGGAILCAMAKQARAAEPEVADTVLRTLGIPIKGAIRGDGLLEGGDVVWLDPHTVAVGWGYRTNHEGIRQLKGLLGNHIEVVVVPLPHWRGPDEVLHLMSLVSPIDRDLALVYAPLLPVPFRQRLFERGMRLVEVPDDEFDSMGSNALALAPRECLMLKGNPGTRTALEGVGVKVHEFEGAEISGKGRGGPTCLTRPLIRA